MRRCSFARVLLLDLRATSRPSSPAACSARRRRPCERARPSVGIAACRARRPRRAKSRARVASDERGAQLSRGVSLPLAARRGELARDARAGSVCQPRSSIGSAGCVEARELRPDVAGRLDAAREHAGLVGELELDAPAQAASSHLRELRAAARAPSARRGRRAAPGRAARAAWKARSTARPVVVEVFDQLHVGLQAEPVEQLQRRGAQQLREPGVEGADLDRPAGREHACRAAPPSSARASRRRAGATPRSTQRRDALAVARARRAKLGEPFVEPLAHLAGRLAREGDREDLVRLRRRRAARAACATPASRSCPSRRRPRRRTLRAGSQASA